jgi:hypothetical protein
MIFITPYFTSCKKNDSTNISININETTSGKSGGGSSVNLSQGLIAYYPFNGNANDESGNGNNGTVNGAILTSDRLGNNNKAYYFNGQSNISIPVLSINTQSISITSFFSIDSYNAAGRRIIEHTWGNNAVFSIAVLSNTLFEACFQLNDGKCRTSTFSVPLNKIISFAAIYDNGTIKNYINGKEILTVSKLNPLQNSNNGIYIGGHDYWTFNGVIDEVRIYNRAITPSEITYIATH